MRNTITMQRPIKRKDKKLLSSDLADETVMMNIETGDYLGLNEVGTHIWRMLETVTTGKEIKEHLMATFEIDANTCQTKVLLFLQRLKKEDMLVVQ